MGDILTIRNAKITSTMLGIVEDYGVFSSMIHLDYGGMGQGFGGWVFDEPFKDGKGRFKGRRGTALGIEFIRRVLEVLEVPTWEKLSGTICRVEASSTKVYRIGHVIKDQWFDPVEIGCK